MSIESIISEAIKTIAQAIRVLFHISWWLGIGLYRLAQILRERLEDYRLKGASFTPSGQESDGRSCSTCQALNEADAHTCFACGARL